MSDILEFSPIFSEEWENQLIYIWIELIVKIEMNMVLKAWHFLKTWKLCFTNTEMSLINALNFIYKNNLKDWFSNSSLTLVALNKYIVLLSSGEKSFSKLRINKNYFKICHVVKMFIKCGNNILKSKI